MPAQPLLVLAAGGDEVLTVVDQQAMSSPSPPIFKSAEACSWSATLGWI